MSKYRYGNRRNDVSHKLELIVEEAMSNFDMFCQGDGSEIGFEEISVQPGSEEVQIWQGGRHTNHLDGAVCFSTKVMEKSLMQCEPKRYKRWAHYL